MRHLPEPHQSVAPDLAIKLIFVAILLTMAVVYLVVTLAD
jgi:hypothetical protein